VEYIIRLCLLPLEFMTFACLTLTDLD